MSFAKLPLETPRLLLRPLEPGDAEALYAIFSDAKVARYGSSPPWSGLDEAHVFIQRAVDALRDGSSLRLGLVRREDGRLIGQCTLFAISAQNRRAEIGYSMASEAWGRGFMDEALRALIDYGFGELAFIRIEADIDPRNIASARTLERLGFEHEGLMRHRWIVAGEVSDTGYYGLLREKWLAPKAGPCDPSAVSLREITADLVRLLHKLQVSESQKGFVAPNSLSLAQALFAPEAWYRAVFCGEELAGFVMLADESLQSPPPEKPQIGVWRFMIDARFQGRGLGRAALLLVIEHARSKGFEMLELSYVPGPGCPEPFYRGLGFAPNGRMDGVEVVMALKL